MSPLYTWHETSEDVTVLLTVGPTVTKPDIWYKLTPEKIELGVKNEPMLLDGELCGAVDTDGSTWMLDSNTHR